MMGTNCPHHQFISKDGRKHAVNCASLQRSNKIKILQSLCLWDFLCLLPNADIMFRAVAD